MFPLIETCPIELEALDTQQRPLFSVHALLHDLHGESATLTTKSNQETSRLRWGSPVRFWLEAETTAYEATGMIVGIEEGTESQEVNDSEPATDLLVSELTLRLRLWELRPKTQQRGGKRRRMRQSLQYRFGETEASSSGEWKRAKMIDLSAGGLRFRTEQTPPNPLESVELRFILAGCAGTHSFERSGTVLRCEARGRTVPAHEIAVKFGAVSPFETLALKKFLSRG